MFKMLTHSLSLGCVLFISMSVVMGQSTPSQAFENQEYESAVESWDQMLKENPDLKDIHYNQGNARFRLGELDEAISSYEQALSVKDRNDLADVYYNMGNAWLYKQELDKAREFYKHALRLRPGDEDAKANLELMNLMPPPPPQEQNSEQNEDDQEQQDSEDQQQQNSQSQDQQDEEQEQEQQPENEEQQNPDEDQQDKQEAEQRNPSESEEEPTQEERLNAEQLLDALKDRETENMREQIRLKTSGQDNEKDW
ncbi:tetratricopeptide repeat protein [bacterium]|nr:tetratricopeptide repeat protein [bacterium]